VTQLQGKFADRSAVIGVIGLGYVGLPVSLRFAEVGFKVIGFDIDESKIKQLNDGRSYIRHFSDEQIRQAIEKGFEATTDFSKAGEADALLICVPTPLKEHREPDLSFVTNTVDSLLPHLRAGQVVSLESTTYPGTTEEELRPRIESTGLTVGEDIFLVFSPEREDPGNTQFGIRSIPKVVGGTTEACLEVGTALYETITAQVVPVSSTRVAELTKLLENIHRAVNIGLVNEMKIVADKMGIDIYEVIDASATKPFGFVPYYPGPGLGGHCIPIDPFYLTWKAREYGINTRFIELAGEVNSAMPEWVVGKIAEALNTAGKAIRGSRVLVLGVAYKPDVSDIRESPALDVIRLLAVRGAEVSFHDPHVGEISVEGRTYKNCDLTADALAAADVTVIVTNHADVDYARVVASSTRIYDTRNATHGVPGARDKVQKL